MILAFRVPGHMLAVRCSYVVDVYPIETLCIQLLGGMAARWYLNPHQHKYVSTLGRISSLQGWDGGKGLLLIERITPSPIPWWCRVSHPIIGNTFFLMANTFRQSIPISFKSSTLWHSSGTRSLTQIVEWKTQFNGSGENGKCVFFRCWIYWSISFACFPIFPRFFYFVKLFIYFA